MTRAIYNYETYVNPQPAPLRDEVRSAIYDREPTIGWDASRRSLAEHVLAVCDVDETWPQSVQQWHASASEWIPSPVFKWWLDQFRDNDMLHTMPSEWWQYRAHRFVSAFHDNTPIGGVALAPVTFTERDIHPVYSDRKHLFYEMRGLVVAPAFRNTAHKVGTRLVATLINEALLAGEKPVFAITPNPNAARIFAATGASSECDHPVFKHLGAPILQGVVCWCAPRADPLCTECPIRPNQLWWWP